MFLGLLLYIGGVVVGLFSTDAHIVGRMTAALLWPLGPLAFVVTITVLIVAALLAFPLFAAGLAAMAAVAWALLR